MRNDLRSRLAYRRCGPASLSYPMLRRSDHCYLLPATNIVSTVIITIHEHACQRIMAKKLKYCLMIDKEQKYDLLALSTLMELNDVL